MMTLSIQISRELSLVDDIRTETGALLDKLQDAVSPATSFTVGFGVRLRNVSDAILDVISECAQLPQLGSRDLEELCSELTSNQELYVPRLNVGVVDLVVGGASPLVQLGELVNDPLFGQMESFDEFSNFLAELVRAISIVDRYWNPCKCTRRQVHGCTDMQPHLRAPWSINVSAQEKVGACYRIVGNFCGCKLLRKCHYRL